MKNQIHSRSPKNHATAFLRLVGPPLHTAKAILCLASAFLILFTCVIARAQSSAYFRAVTNLNPAGYWPLHEVAPPAPGDIETNFGSLGLLGTGYYPDWTGGTSTVGIDRQFPGALAGDPDKAVYFTEPASNSGSTTNSLSVPHASPLATLTPPFSVEVWFYPTNSNQGDIWSQAGYEGLNAGSSGGGAGAVNGIRLYWAGPGFEVYTYNNSSTLNGFGASGSFPAGQWYHVVVTDDGTNLSIYVNGNYANATTQPASKYAPDYWTPFEVGDGRGNTRAVKGVVDEVAVYTNVLQDISAHYAAGINPNPSPTYFQLVKNDNPTIYLRLDAPPYTPPPASTWPVATNYGSLGANGVYTPGTVPGIVPGPASASGLAYGGLAGANVALFSGISSFVDVGYETAYDPIGAIPFSVAVLFRGNPADNRFQNIVGHSNNSWRLSLNTNGKLQETLGATSASVINSTGVYNDGNWHQAVFIYQPASNPNLTGTNALFVDGVLDSAATVNTNGILPGSPLDILIAADPQYTNSPVGPGRQFAGEVSDVALFTNALTSAQVAALYNALGVPPGITQQPVSANVNQNSAFTNAVTVTGGTPLAFQWYQNSHARSGQTNASLVLNPVQPTDAGTYYLVVTNVSGAVTSSVVTLTVNSSPLILSEFPVAYTNLITLFAGANPNFSATAGGAQPLYYQWFTNGVAVGRSTNTSLTLSNVQHSFSTYVVATNFVGAVTSAVWSTSVVAAPTAAYPQAVLAANPLAYWRLNEPDDGLGDGNAGAIAHDYAGGNDGIYTNVNLGQPGYNAVSDPTETSAEFGETGLSPFDSDAGQIAGVDFATPTNKSATFTIEAWVNGFAGGQTSGAGVIAKGYGNGGEQFDLDLYTGVYRFFVRDVSGATHGTTTTFKPDGNWHHLAGVVDEVHGSVSLYIDGTLAGSGTVAPGSGIQEATNLLSIGARASTYGTNNNFQFDGFINDVAIYNYALSANQIQAQYGASGVPPLLTQAPSASLSANASGTLVLPATVIGTPPIGYQWFDQSGGTNVSAVVTNAVSLNASLTISNVPPTWNNDTLELTVTNAYGSTNYYVTLTVYTNAPQISEGLLPQVILPAGKPYVYSIGVVGPTPYGYKWYEGATLLAGETGPELPVTAGSAGNSATYFVVITNVFGAVTSSVSTLSVVAQLTNSYATSLLGYGPAGYWPLQETNPPALANYETNYGSLGVLGTAYYAATNASTVTFDQTGALSMSGDNDPSVQFNGNNTSVSYAFVPRISPDLTLTPPFSLETWVESSSTTFADLLSEGGNGFDSAASDGNYAGFRVSYAGNNGGGPELQAYIYNGSGSTYNDVGTPVNSLTFGNWHHGVTTYDGTNVLIYLDGTLQASAAYPLAIDTWSPFIIGSGRWQGGVATRGYTGLQDEVAVYTNLLSATQVSNHYLAATTYGSNYFGTVLADNPLLYYRLDDAGYATPGSTTNPVAVNYGSAPVNGSYPPGILPGGVAGPAIAALGTNSLAAPGNGIISAVDAGFDPSFNPTGTQPFSAVAWFRTYPADGRVQTIIGHGVNWSLNLDGTTGDLVWNTIGSVTSTKVFNDGEWHQAVGVFNGSTSYLYVDGALNSSATTSGSLTSDTADDLWLGGNAANTLVGINQQYFAGAIAQAAFYTNALTAAEVSGIYDAAAGIKPTVGIVPDGRNVVITYTGTLLSAPSVSGPYTPVTGANSPYTTPATNAQLFYRAQQ